MGIYPLGYSSHVCVHVMCVRAYVRVCSLFHFPIVDYVSQGIKTLIW